MSPLLRLRPKEWSDAQLVLAARAQQLWAFEALYHRHRAMARRVAASLVEPCDCDDLVQEAFLKALERLHQLAHPETFQAWFVSILSRTAIQRLQRDRLRSRARGSAGAQVVLERMLYRPPPAEAVAELHNVEEILASVDGELRAAFVLRHMRELSVEQVAAALGRSVATVKRRLTRADGVLDRRLKRH